MNRPSGDAAVAQFRTAVQEEAPETRLADLRRAAAWAKKQLLLGVPVDGARSGPKPIATLNVQAGGRDFLTVFHAGSRPGVTLGRAFEKRAPAIWAELEARGLIDGMTVYDLSAATFVLLSRAVVEARGSADGALPRGRLRAYQSPHIGEGSATRDPFLTDPNLLDRATRRHMEIQLALEQRVRQHGYSLTGGAESADIDLGWLVGDHLVIAEVKTTTQANKSKQLRLGLGQLIDYVDTLTAEVVSASGVLVTDRRPPPRWVSLCAAHGIRCAWSPGFSGAFVES